MVFNFPGQILEFMQTLFHFSLPFPNFLGHVVHFCKSTWANLMETCWKPLQTFLSIVTYLHVLENACPKQIPR
jgi:hypothetical protein